MEAPSPLRQRAFRSAARLLHALGLVALLRPLLNGARLRRDEEGRLAFPFVRLQRLRNAQILIYHRVNDEGDPYFGGTPTAVFERQMAYISSRFHVLPLSELVARLESGTLPDQALSVTLDDGYRDNYVHAFPILRRHSIPATIFLATSAIGSSRPLWHDDVFSAFRETKASSLEGFGPSRIGGPLGTVEERLRVQRAALAHVRTLDDDGRARAVAELRQALGVGAPREEPGLMLTWDEVGRMSQAGIRFGSHTATHPILSRVDRAVARRELFESKRAIEERLGLRVEGFAYPNGSPADFLPETKDLLREIGYAYAVTTIPGANEPGQDVFELRRGTPWEEDIFAFGARLHYTKLH